MTTYLLITSDKPTELTAFVGPKEPQKCNIPDCLNLDNCEKSVVHRAWKSEMETAKASRLPVAHKLAEIGMHWFCTSEEFIFTDDKQKSTRVKIGTPVELEGWEVEEVKQYSRNGTDKWFTPMEGQLMQAVSYHRRQAYRLKRSEPVKELPEECQDPIASFGGCVFGGSNKNYCKKCVNESPIEAKTQETEVEKLNKVIDAFKRDAEQNCEIIRQQRETINRIAVEYAELKTKVESHKTQENQADLKHENDLLWKEREDIESSINKAYDWLKNPNVQKKSSF